MFDFDSTIELQGVYSVSFTEPVVYLDALESTSVAQSVYHADFYEARIDLVGSESVGNYQEIYSVAFIPIGIYTDEIEASIVTQSIYSTYFGGI